MTREETEKRIKVMQAFAIYQEKETAKKYKKQ